MKLNRILAALLALNLSLAPIAPALANDLSNSTWSETDSSNNNVSPNGWKSGTMLPSEVEPVGRAMMGGIKRFYDHVNATATAGGTNNVQTLTYSVAPASYAGGDCYVFFPLTNTGATTINVNAIGAKNIKIGTSALIGGEMHAGKLAEACYDGADFQLLRGGDVAGQYLGTNTNDSATAGNIGELLTASVANASAVALTTATAANITSLSLTPGDWEVSGNVWFKGGATTTVSDLRVGISSTSATLPGDGGTDRNDLFYNSVAVFGAVSVVSVPVGPFRISLSANNTVYLVTNSTFGTSTLSGFGTIRARRVR